MSPGEATTTETVRGVPRSLVLAESWTALGKGLEPLSNAAGRPLARTVKLILDPLIIRPTDSPHLGAALLDEPAAQELRKRIDESGGQLRATAAWFVALKKARRAARITEGNPQDLYFQLAYELAHLHGDPSAQADDVAASEIAELHGTNGRLTASSLRDYLADPRVRSELQQLIELTWSAREAAERDVALGADLRRFLDTVATIPDTAAFADLVDAGAGSTAAAALRTRGAARRLGLTVHATVRVPAIGTTASKSALPYPFDRSILERLFAAVSTLSRAGLADTLAELVDREVQRVSGPWQLATEEGRVLLLIAREAGRALEDAHDSTDAGVRLRARWQREPFVQRALRLSAVPAEAAGAREAHMRRLWVRLHGRELRAEPITADQAWDLLDGALRSVILDRRDRVKASLEVTALADLTREAIEGARR